jgi:Alginate lyase
MTVPTRARTWLSLGTVALAAAMVGALTTTASAGIGPTAVSKPPGTVLLDGTRLATIRQQVATRPTAPVKAALAALRKTADADLRAGPWSVMDKTRTAPSGDRHDYFSQAPYWWPTTTPTPSNPLGCPYEQRDGQRNPAADKISDHAESGLAWQAIHDLALAWYYTGDPRYAGRAERDVRTWFLDSATRMRPNLTYAQIIPCRTAVRGTGIIETSEFFPQLLDGLALLDSGAPGWTSQDRDGMRQWMSGYLNWSLTSPQGKAESAAANNHGAYKDVQDIALAVYTGQQTMAAKLLAVAGPHRISTQIDATGRQPLELARTRTWHYSNFNLTALCRLAAVGEHIGTDLWAYRAASGASLALATDFLIPGAEHGRSAWNYQEIGSFDQFDTLPILHAAAEHGDTAARAAIPHVPSSGVDLWPLEPAC